MLFKHRQRFGQIVAIGVVGGDGGELPVHAAALDALDRLVQRNESVPTELHVGDHGIEEIRRDVEVPVDAERLFGRGRDPMQHQDRADAADEWPGERRQPGIPGHVEGQFPDRFAPVDHSFTFYA